MTLITNEVYDYMLDDVQRSAMRSISKMNDVVDHLKLQAGANVKIEAYIGKAESVQTLLRRAAKEIDELPALGADLEALAGNKIAADEDTTLVHTISESEAIDLVGRRMTRGALEQALLEHFNAERVQYNLKDNTFTIFREEEQS